MYKIPRTERGLLELDRFKTELQMQGYKISTPRKIGGYLSRKCTAVISDYSGNYGRGLKIEMPCFESTGFHWVIYAIIPETDDNK